MPTENVRVLNQNVNPSVTELCQWLGKKAECGDIPESSARLAATAIQALNSNLDADEPADDAVFVQQNLEKLANRWSTRNTDAKADTARTYLTRARGALEKYFAWRENPAGFRFERRARQPKEASSQAPRPEAVQTSAPAAPPPPPPPTPQTSTSKHRFKVAPDKYVTFELPEEGLTLHEWKRWCVHVLTLCEDYDPDSPQPTLSLTVPR